MQAVVGVDVGGTTTRVGVASPDGTVLLALDGPGANPNTVGLDGTAARVRDLVGGALVRTGVPTADVAAVTVALAGGTRVLASPDLLADFRRAVAPVGLTAVPEVVLDVAAAFSAGSPADAGRVLVAGTGSIAAVVDGGRVRRRAGGWGWMLGDEGSGFWLGREAVRSALVRSESPAAGDNPLTAAVLRAYDVAAVEDLLPAVYAADPAATGPARPAPRLAALSVTVAGLVDVDPVAAALVDEAVGHLTALVAGLADPASPTGSIVLAGSLLTTPGPVARGVRDRLGADGSRVVTAAAAVVGPLWLAIRGLGPPDDDVHRRLVATVDTEASGRVVAG